MLVKLKSMIQNGFTLIECLVALFIIALVLASATRAMGLSIDDVRSSYVREVANWVASNDVNDVLISGTYPDIGTVTKDVQMAGISYIVVETVVATPNPYFRKIDVAVKEKSSPDHVVFRTVNFISQY